MSSLWTPGGEHRVPREGAGGHDGGRGGHDSGRGRPAGSPGRAGGEVEVDGVAGDGIAEAELAAEELAALEAELAAVPAADVVANHCYGLFELAAVHLRQQPPRLDQAAVAIDALGAVVERLGARLGASAAQLQEGLTSIRLVYVQLASPPPADPDAAGAEVPPAGTETAS